MTARQSTPSAAEQLRAELALQIEAEIKRGLSLWPDPEWNAAAMDFLASGMPAAMGAAATPRPGTRPGARAETQPETQPETRPAPRSEARPQARTATPAAARATAPEKKKQLPTFGPPPAAEGREADWEQQLDALRREAKGCTACPLHETRQNVVVDSGSGKVPLVFVGEAPGADEDAQGDAFVGRAGKLLTKIIAAIGLDRREVYICNVIKCRPPGNRNPQPVEIETCSPYLRRQLEILKPRVICTLGLFATQLLLDSKAPIGKLRGRLFHYQGIPLIPTYHPAALLRNPNLKRTVWEDVQLLRKVLDEGTGDITPAVELTTKRETPKGPRAGDLFAER